MLALLLWSVTALIFRLRFQFSIRTLLVLAGHAACRAGGSADDPEKEGVAQGQAMEPVRKSGGWTRYERDRFAGLPMSQRWSAVRARLAPQLYGGKTISTG